MLVLTRKQGETIVIGDNVRLTVVAIKGHSVQLGITAPTEIPIRRMELCCPAVRPKELDSTAGALPARRDSPPPVVRLLP